MKTIAAALATASMLAIAGPAFAQHTPAGANTMPASTTPQEGSSDAAAQPDQADSDIIVTAQRRQERVTEVPISITVANQGQLERQQVNTINDLSRIAPSLEIQQAPGQNTGGGGAIRGIGTQTFSAGAVPSVGIVVDQVSQGNANIGDLFDVARIEVLKGPQGTLFGLTTSAGVINITTNAPDPTGFSARVRMELSDQGTAGSKFGNQIVQGVVNIPLGENAALRMSGLANFRQGVNRNTLTGDFNDNNRYGGRARLLWTPTDSLTFNLIGDYTRSSSNGGGDFFTFVKADAADTALLARCGVTPRSGNQDYCTTQTARTRNFNYGGSFQMDYDAGPFTLTSVTAYRENKGRGPGTSANVFRADTLPLQVQNPLGNSDLSLYTQEVRVSSAPSTVFDYTVGVFFSRQREDRNPQQTFITLNPAPNVFIPILRSLGFNDTVFDTSLAVFGQGTLHVTPSFRLIAGGRYTSEKLSLDRYPVQPAQATYLGRRLSVDKPSWRFGAQYDLSRITMAYATATRGYKSGQVATPNPPLSPYIVQPEVPTSYEAGLKTTLFTGWVADFSAFYQTIRNFQAQQCVTNTTTSAIDCLATNINGVKSRGAELNFFGRVFDGLSLNTGFIYAKATYPNRFVGTDGTQIGGSQLAYAPRYKFTASGEYETQVSTGFKAFFAADTVWKSRIRFEANSRDASTYGPHWLTGGRVGVRTEDDRYQLAVFARNLFNVHEPILMQTDFPSGGSANVGAIYGTQSFRQIGLSLDAKF